MIKIVNGLKNLNLDNMPLDGWQNKLYQSNDVTSSPLRKRCEDFRSNAVASIPFKLQNLNGEDLILEGIYSVDHIRQLLIQIEKSMLTYSAAYILFDEMRLLEFNTMTPVYDSRYGLTGFKRMLSGDQIDFSLDEIIYFHDISCRETVLDPSSFECAKMFLQAYHSVVEFVGAFFKNGTIKSTLLYVEGMPTNEEKDRLKSFWKRAMQGVKNAFSVEIVRVPVQPIEVGNGIDDLKIDILDNITGQVLLAYAVPASLVLPSAANYATAESDKFNFYENTVIPRILYYQSVFNQALNKSGLKIIFDYQTLPLFQKLEADRAAMLKLLVESGFTLLEAIDTLGYDISSEMRKRLERDTIINFQADSENLLVDMRDMQDDN